MLLLVLAVCFAAAAVFALSEAATYPARLKARSIRRASDYGRVRVPEKAGENLRFRERVVGPASARLAAIPLKLNPTHEHRADRRPAPLGRPRTAHHRRRRSWR